MAASIVKDVSKLCIHTITTKPWSLQTVVDKFSVKGVKGITIWRQALEGIDISKVRQIIDAFRLQKINGITCPITFDTGIAQYFSNAAFSVDSTLPAWTDTSISPGPSGFIVRVDGNASSSDCTGTPVNCAMHSDVVADFDLEMDNTGRVFISYDGTNWTEY